MWTCRSCSYAENSDARSRCEICDSTKPPQAAPAPARAPTPVGPDWSCSVCTLKNSGRDAKCTACGTDRPAAFAASRAAPPARPLPASGSGAGTPLPRPSPSPPPAPIASIPVRPSPSASPAPVLPRASSRSQTPTSDFQPGEGDISFLTSMGFSRPQAISALQASRSRDTALDLLLSQAQSPPPPKASSAAAASSTQKPQVAAGKLPVAAAASSKPAAAAAAAPVPVVKKLSPAEQRAFDEREAKRQALLKQLDDEAQAKVAAAKAKAAASTPAAAAPKKATSSAPASASVISASVTASPPAEAAAAPAMTEEQKKLASIQAEREAATERVRMSKLRVQKRLEAEQRLRSLPDVLASLRANYDPLRFTSIIQMLRKILDKIVADQGKTDKFRRIPLDNPKLELTLVRPIGPIWILKQVGFEERVEGSSSSSGRSASSPSPMDVSDTEGPIQNGGGGSDSGEQQQRVLVMDANKVNLKALQQLSSTLGQQLEAQHSSIPTLFHSMLASKRYGTEQLYHLALELKHIVHNLIVSVDEIDEHRESMTDVEGGAAASSSSARRRDTVNKNFRQIDKLESAYQKRIKPIVESKAILSELGFGLDPHDQTRQYLVVPAERMSAEGSMRHYQIVLRELNEVIAHLRTQTPIAQGLARLCAQNRQKPMERFVEQLLTALRLVVNNKFEQKFCRIVLSKLQAKVGTKPSQLIRGMAEFVALFGFEPAPAPEGDHHAALAQNESGRVALPFPPDTELLAIRADELEHTWKALVQQAAAETGQTTGWSFE